MARAHEELTWVAVKNLTKPGAHRVSPNLYVAIGAEGGRSWVFRYRLNGRSKEMGLGSLIDVGLAEARDAALAARRLVKASIDPIKRRRDEKKKQQLEDAAAAVTFRKAAQGYIQDHKAAWRNEKHAWQWGQTLEAHVYPVIGDASVAAVNTGHVTRILRPIWTTKAETASRVRGRIEVVLDYAKANEWRAGENPARWKGHLDHILPPRSQVAKVAHHPALPWRDMGAFVADLNKQEGIAALALRFVILTAARTGEAIGARWPEVDMTNGLWTVPGARMKAGKDHRVPLTESALAILRVAAKARRDDGADGAFVFPGGKGGKGAQGLSNMALLGVLHRMERRDLTVHGFRSSFRDWASETTGYQREVVEAALAHAIPDKVEAAYRRGDLFEKRRRLMDEWATFCSSAAANRPQGDRP